MRVERGSDIDDVHHVPPSAYFCTRGVWNEIGGMSAHRKFSSVKRVRVEGLLVGDANIMIARLRGTMMEEENHTHNLLAYVYEI
jgi:hypothetical protein